MEAMQYPGISLWGDSIGRGIDFDPLRGRYAVLRQGFARLLAQRGIIEIDNHAKFGATVTEGLEDFEATEQIACEHVAIQYAGNDCNMNWAAIADDPAAEHLANTPLKPFEETLRRFVQRVRERGCKPLLVTSPPLHAQRFVDWVTQGLDKEVILRFLGDVQHVYRWQERYTLVVRRVAAQLAVPLFDLRDAFLAADDFPGLCGIDGMHPNEAGHRLMADAAEPALARLF